MNNDAANSLACNRTPFQDAVDCPTWFADTPTHNHWVNWEGTKGELLYGGPAY